MIDWGSLGTGALWVTGLAVMLAVASYAGWCARTGGRRLRQVWQPRFDLVLNGGALLLTLGWTLSEESEWQCAIGLVCALGFAALAVYDVVLLRRSGGGLAWDAGPCAADIASPPGRLPVLWQRAIFPLSLAATLLTFGGRRLSLLGLGLMLLVWLAGWVLVRRPIVASPLSWPLTLILLASLVGTVVSVDRALSQSILRSLLAGVTLLLAALRWADTRRRLGVALSVLVLAGTGLAVVAPLSRTEWMTGRFFEVPALFRRTAVLPETVHPNVLAGALVLVLPVALSLLFRRRAGGRVASLVRRVGLALCCALMLGVLVLTQSRGGLAAFAVSMAALALLRWRPARVLVPCLAAGAAVGACRLGYRRALDLLLAGGGFASFEGRLEVWSRAIYMLQDFPFTGIGLGTFPKIAPIMYPFFLAGPEAVIPHAHNLFLQVGVDLGLPGLIAFLALLLLSVFTAWRVYSQAHEPYYRALAAGLLASHVGLAAHGLVDAAVWGQKPSFVFWLILGLTAAMWRVAEG